MSSKSASPAPRNSENKLYQACLASCIEGIGNLQVDKRPGSGGEHLAHLLGSRAFLILPTTTSPATLGPANDTPHEAASPTKPQSVASLPSPPPSPVISSIPELTPSPSHSSAFTAAMDRLRLHGAPPRGTPPPSWGLQDARSNFAIQPAANAGSIKLKKNAVKIVGAAGPVPSTASRPAAPAPTLRSSPAVESAPAKAKEADGHVPATTITKPITTAPAPTPVPSTTVPKPSDTTETALADIFSRLMAQGTGTFSRTTEGTAPSRPDTSMFSFEDRSGARDTPAAVLQTSISNPPTTPAKPNTSEAIITTTLPEDKMKPAKRVVQQEDKTIKPDKDASQKDLEHEYLRKASEYLGALPAGSNTTVQTIKVVLEKLRISYVPDVKVDSDKNEALKARYVFAVSNYVKQLNKDAKPPTIDFVKQVLKDNDGNFLHLCAVLVQEKCIAQDSLNDVTGLCKAILDILPNPEPVIAVPATTTSRISTTAAVKETKPGFNDPVDKMTAWPAPERREHAAIYRTCILKGVTALTSINQLQALVWGGRLESIAMPETGSNFAIVKFLTPEGCDKYHKATANGIELPGNKKSVVFVEMKAEPNSVNDVIENCVKCDATRCVRVVDIEEDWSDMALMRLARGKDKTKREVDRIKRSKTKTCARNLVEFRFASIYHALNFKRQLTEDDEFQACTISYAPDPCDTARGVHFKDEDEGDSGSSI